MSNNMKLLQKELGATELPRPIKKSYGHYIENNDYPHLQNLNLMSQLFKDVLTTLPDIDHVIKIKLYDTDGNFVGDIENLQGTKGSLKVYFYLYKNFKEINLEAAHKGLELFSEHTAEAKKHSGNHPNIDRLIDILQTNNFLRIETILR